MNEMENRVHIWPLPRIEFMPFFELEETRPVALLTGRPTREAVRDRLHLSISWQADVTAATETHWQSLLANLTDSCEIAYAVCGGLAVDAAKYIAARCDLPLVCLPTALSVDAFLTWASGVRREGCVYYVETKSPDHLVIDWEVITAAPAPHRVAGICDVLSIVTGSWDWRFAEERSMNPPGTEYVPYVDQATAAILKGVLDCAEAAGHGDADVLKQLLDCLALQAQLCNQLGHARPVEGSEHYFAYALENLVGRVRAQARAAVWHRPRSRSTVTADRCVLRTAAMHLLTPAAKRSDR
jgi:glycerol-1-phosphate dehydrogenase [NAD(P)+]